MRGDRDKWLPCTGEWFCRQTTGRRADGWLHLGPDFGSRAWGLAVSIVFHADHCGACLDGFALREVDR